MDDWRVSILGPTGETELPPLIRALESVLTLFGLQIVDPREHLPADSGYRRLIIAYPACEKALLDYVLRDAYGTQAQRQTKYLFLETGLAFGHYDALKRTFVDIGIAIVEEPSKLVAALARVLHAEPTRMSPRVLRQAIESSVFPSGAEEMQEILFRDPSVLHGVFTLIESQKPQLSQSRTYRSAVRVLFGAFASGDVARPLFQKAFDRIVATTNSDNAEAEELRATVLGKVHGWAEEVERHRQSFELDEANLSCLSDYLSRRHILVVEDQLSEEFWEIVLPAVLGSERPLERDATHQQVGESVVTHAQNALETERLLKAGRLSLRDLDVVLLDLYSSVHSGQLPERYAGALLSTIGSSAVHLAERLEDLNRRQVEYTDDKQVPPSPLPQLVVFSKEGSGVTARTLLKDLGASDYFFKVGQAEAHKQAYYATFRNAIIDALKNTLAHVTQMSGPGQRSNASKWLGQFSTADRPILLRLMKEFRYYSAASLIQVFDEYLGQSGMYTTRPGDKPDMGKLSLFESQHVRPTHIWFSYLGHPNKSGASSLALLSKAQFFKDVRDDPNLTGYRVREGQPVFMTYQDLCVRLLAFAERNERTNPVVKRVLDKLPPLDEHDGLCIVVVDDTIGSGGQLTSYMWKFLNRDLPLASEMLWGPEKGKQRWLELRERLWQADEGGRSPVDLHFVCAVGIANPHLAAIGTELRFDGTVNTVLSSRRFVSFVRICERPGVHTGPDAEGHELCKCPERVQYTVHVLDCVGNVEEACRRQKLKFSNVLVQRNVEFGPAGVSELRVD